MRGWPGTAGPRILALWHGLPTVPLPWTKSTTSVTVKTPHPPAGAVTPHIAAVDPAAAGGF
jgi:hypothetical protein